VYCWAAAPLTVTNSSPAVTVAVETRDAAIARIICTFMAYLPSRDPRRDVLPRAGVRVGSEFDLAANAASMDRHRFPRDSGRIPPISLGRARERDITGTFNRTRTQRCTRAAQRQGAPGEVEARLSDRRRRPFAMPRARPESGWPGRRSESAPRRVVPQINEIGQLTGKQRIGEFAENAEIIQVLTSLGVDYAQGYGVAQPQRVVKSAVA